MIYGSVCSGIEAATAAWHPLGWRPAFFSEIEKFPSAVLAHHYPDIPNLGDMTKFEEWPDAKLNVLVGGTPCQSFSVAGLRKGLDDARGNLMLVYAAIARRYRPEWLVWENVPGVLSSDGGRDFGSLLGLLSGQRVSVPVNGWKSAGVVPGIASAYGLAWRVLDAQFVRVDGLGRAVPQRRRRVFVVGYLGDWRRAAAVLFERASMRGDSPPRRQTGERASPTLAARTQGGGDKPHVLLPFDETQITSATNRSNSRIDGACHTMAKGALPPTVAFRTTGNDGCYETGDVSACLNTASDPSQITLLQKWRVRRLMPEECEKLQGFPEGYTKIPYPKPAWSDKFPERVKYAADGSRYRACGNSMAVNCMRWIGTRIGVVNGIEGVI